MGRMYSIPIAFVAQTGAIDFFELLAGTNKGFNVHEIYIAQSTEIGDAQEEMLRLDLKRATGSVTSGSGGTTPTPAPLGVDDTASGITAEVNNTTKLAVGTGTVTVMRSYAWNVRMPFQMIFTPETRPRVKGGDRIVLELVAAPTDSTTMGGYVIVEEV